MAKSLGFNFISEYINMHIHLHVYTYLCCTYWYINNYHTWYMFKIYRVLNIHLLYVSTCSNKYTQYINIIILKMMTNINEIINYNNQITSYKWKNSNIATIIFSQWRQFLLYNYKLNKLFYIISIKF